jgi:plastocyanin
MTKLAQVLAIVIGRFPRDLHRDRPMEHGQRSRIADLPATVPMIGLARALKATLRSRPLRGAAPLRLLASAPALAIVVAACSGAYGGGGPTYSYVPPSSPSGSPASSMSATAGAPAMSATPAVSGPVSGAPSPTGSAAATDATLHISAQNIQFDTDHLEAPAAQAFVLEFDNNDPGIPHNVEIKDATGASVFKGEIITGPAKASYQAPALAAGSYMFLCDVHPTMTGTVTVK